MVLINDASRGTYNKFNQITICDAYILVSRTIAITETGADDNAKRLDERIKE